MPVDHDDHDHELGDHDHAHDHGPAHGSGPGPFQPDIAEPRADWELLEIALRELLIDKGVITAAEIASRIEEFEGKSAAAGAHVVAHAWLDPAYKARLLADGNQGVVELGYEVPSLKLVVLENTAALHHMVVCTLCSCYPRALIGLPPLWYKSRAYRSRAVSEPRAVLAEFGTRFGDGTEVRVVDSTADCRFLVLPRRPAGTEGWSEAQLAALVTRDSLIGTATALDAQSQRR